jgi:hypothetical protein
MKLKLLFLAIILFVNKVINIGNPMNPITPISTAYAAYILCGCVSRRIFLNPNPEPNTGFSKARRIDAVRAFHLESLLARLPSLFISTILVKPPIDSMSMEFISTIAAVGRMKSKIKNLLDFNILNIPKFFNRKRMRINPHKKPPREPAIAKVKRNMDVKNKNLYRPIEFFIYTKARKLKITDNAAPLGFKKKPPPIGFKPFSSMGSSMSINRRKSSGKKKDTITPMQFIKNTVRATLSTEFIDRTEET